MNYYLDTEFIEHAGGIELVSIGIVSEDGKKFYAESSDFNPELADDWVRENVFKKLYVNPFDADKRKELAENAGMTGNHDMLYGSNKTIADAILRFIGDENPVFYADYAAYDWVVFCRLFGRLVDKPKHFPYFAMDTQQMLKERGLDAAWVKENCPEPENAHNAFVDAMYVRDLHHAIIKWEEDNYHKKFNALREKLSIILQDDRWIEGSDITEILNEILEAISHYGYLRYPPRREMEESLLDQIKLELLNLSDVHKSFIKFVLSDGEHFKKFSPAHQILLKKQEEAMGEYMNILEVRIELLESQSQSNNNIEILKSKSK